jgi:hypothetical protein
VKGVRVTYEGCKTTAVISRDGKEVARGIAYWNPQDPYDKHLGKTIAIGRAQKELAKNAAETYRADQLARVQDERDWRSLARGKPTKRIGIAGKGLDKETLSEMLVQALKVSDTFGLTYVHLGDDVPASYAVLTIDRLNALVDRVFPDGNGIPVDDPEWTHEHVEPENVRGVHAG